MYPRLPQNKSAAPVNMILIRSYLICDNTKESLPVEIYLIRSSVRCNSVPELDCIVVYLKNRIWCTLKSMQQLG